jgi:hypothetical protein
LRVRALTDSVDELHPIQSIPLFEIDARPEQQRGPCGTVIGFDVHFARVELALPGKAAPLRSIPARANARAPDTLLHRTAARARRWEISMRKYVDCREFPSDVKCSIAISADTDKELIDAAVQHAVAVHGHKDTPEFRQQLASAMHEGTPPLKAKAMA